MKALMFVVAMFSIGCGERYSHLSLDVEAPPMRRYICDSGMMEDSSPYIPDPPTEDVVDAGNPD